MDDDSFDFHVDDLAAKVHEALQQLNADRAAGRAPSPRLVETLQRLDRAITEYKASAPAPGQAA